jgi:hypothetical protein
MIGDKAIRIGVDLPGQYRRMARVMCDFSPDKWTYCGATFWIIHQDRTVDKSRADRQVGELKRILAGEHIDETELNVHQRTYELND